jgi:hypothetical protein
MSGPPAAPPGLDELVQQTRSQLGSIFEQMEWAEDEIEQAQRRHPAQAALLWTTFRLLVPTRDIMRTEFVYRSHSRELLERVAAGKDTRPGTYAEMAIACCETSLLAPLSTAGAGFYMRVWAKAFPDQPLLDADEQLGHCEALEGNAMDDHENVLRQKLSRPRRRLDTAPEQKRLPL